MQIIRNILQITPSGANLTDIYGSETGVELSMQLGTAVKLEFELHGEQSEENSSAFLPDYPIEDLNSTAYYFALDLNCANTDSPVLLNFTGVSLSVDSNGKSVMSVVIPNTAVEQMVAAMKSKTSQSFFAELGGIAEDGTANFAWQFKITMQSRVYLGSEGENTPVNDPEYYTALQVEAVIGRQLFFEYSSDGVSWHDSLIDGDIYMRVKHGENGNYSPAQLIPYGPQGEKGEPGADGKDGVDGKGLDINAAGTLENRTAYDAESSGFAYFATDTKLLYIKNSDASADWSEGFPIYEVTAQEISALQDLVDGIQTTAETAAADALAAYNRSVEVEQNLGNVEATASVAREVAEEARTTAQNAEPKMTPVDMLDYDPLGAGQQVVDIHLEGNKYYFQNEEAGDSIVEGLSVASVEQTLSEIIMRFRYIGGGVSFPDTLQWIGTPSFESGKIYVISIINNVAVAGVIE